MFRATEPPRGDVREYLSREMNRLSSELADGAAVYPTLQNGFTNWGSPYSLPCFRRDHHGRVTLDGLVKDGTGGTNSYCVVMILPEKYRPLHQQVMAATQGGATSGEFLRIDIRTTGEVAAYLWNRTWLSLSGISFYAGR